MPYVTIVSYHFFIIFAFGILHSRLRLRPALLFFHLRRRALRFATPRYFCFATPFCYLCYLAFIPASASIYARSLGWMIDVFDFVIEICPESYAWRAFPPVRFLTAGLKFFYVVLGLSIIIIKVGNQYGYRPTELQ